MKKVLDVSIGRINFTIEEDAYFRLREYMRRFEATIPDKNEAQEVMEDVEARIAEIFLEKLKYPNQVVDMRLVDIVIEHLGEVEQPQSEDTTAQEPKGEYTKGEKRLFRDMDRKNIAGVCSGLSIYSNIDVTIIRILFVVFAFFYGFAIPVYIVLWIVMPKAITVAQKLQLRGLAPTAENIRLYTFTHKYQNS